jgi:diguanylate cyclase
MEAARERSLRLARRVYPLRVVGLALGFLCVAAAFHERGAPPWAWAALAFHGFAWPHVAFMLARRSKDPYGTEERNLIIDSALGGVWIPLMGFNLLPSVLLVAMLSMDKASVGGPPFLLRTAIAMAAACSIVTALTGFDFRPETSLLVVAACVPLMVVYPLAVGMDTYRLRRRIREQNAQLEVLVRIDSLSGLLNRRSWEEAVTVEYMRHRRSGESAALLLIDLDNFKDVNDRLGHLAGDEVIRGLARVLRETLRTHDVPGRYGGDEFGVVLPDADLSASRMIAERIRTDFSAAVARGAIPGPCSLSIGMAMIGVGVASPAQWVERADRALYEAKNGGRDRTGSYSPLGDR